MRLKRAAIFMFLGIALEKIARVAWEEHSIRTGLISSYVDLYVSRKIVNAALQVCHGSVNHSRAILKGAKAPNKQYHYCVPSSPPLEAETGTQ